MRNDFLILRTKFIAFVESVSERRKICEDKREKIHGEIIKKMRQHSPCILVSLIISLLLFRPINSYALVVVFYTYTFPLYMRKPFHKYRFPHDAYSISHLWGGGGGDLAILFSVFGARQ
jgi:hypothetical protein